VDECFEQVDLGCGVGMWSFGWEERNGFTGFVAVIQQADRDAFGYDAGGFG